MNWYHLSKTANSELGMTLGKWLVLETMGQMNEVSVQNDIMGHVMNNAIGLDLVEARSVAINYFMSQTKTDPSADHLARLDQWLSMVGGESLELEPVPQDFPLGTGVVE